MNKLITLTAAVLALSTSVAFAAPDEDILGKSQGYPIFRNPQSFNNKPEYLVGTLSNFEKVYSTQTVKRGEILPLIKSDETAEIRYNYQGSKSLDDYMNRNRVTGLMIIKNDKVLVERYQYDRTAEMQFVSMSIAKSINALLIGIALQEGKIASLDDEVIKYVPELKKTAYANVTIRNLLRMLSGAKFSQRDDAGGDNRLLNQRTWFRYGSGGAGALDFVEEQAAQQGTTFNYNAGDSFVLGLVLKAAIGNTSVAEYMSEKLWKPIGAESDANWIVDSSKSILSNCCFTAVLRDYARIGMLLANDGIVNGKQIISKQYLMEATSVDMQPDVNKPRINGKGIGYGYQIWVHPIKTRTFALYGHYGQSVFVQPESKTVVVITSAWSETDQRRSENERYSFHIGVLRSLGADAVVYK